MIVCLYGRPFAPFVEPVARDLCDAVNGLGTEMRAITIEDAYGHGRPFEAVKHLYVLPFDPPESAEQTTVQDLVADLFPHARPIVSVVAHELCWNKIATQERLRDRGVPIPETLVTVLPEDVIEFVGEHEFAVLKESHSCGGQGHLIVWLDDGQLVGDCGSHRYAIDLVRDGRRRLHGDRLSYPGPYYLQRLIADIDPRGVTPPQVLRAYVVDREIVFWTERYREHYTRPSDWIINHALGARYRFVQNVSAEAEKIALRAADVVGARVAAVDLVRTGRGGIYVIEVDCDGSHMFVDRSFKEVPDYRDYFDLDRYIAQLIVNEAAVPLPPAF